ncbi:MAG TPA: YajQ family cyclic di-GMP-binding protein [Thermoanaerobaculia bacterium]|nr:YajQ family cyclic di-GMP-binding protein [Thermoanaerobaculia bacterium]
MAESSYDVVSQVDFQEVRNAATQAEKEIATRYDLKRVGAKLSIAGEELEVEAADDFTIGQAREVLESKLVKRGVHLKSLRKGDIQPASGGRVRQKLTFQQGIPIETARKIVAEIKRAKLKVQAAIQSDTVRVSGKSRDDLQKVIALLKAMDLDVPLTFTNYR